MIRKKPSRQEARESYKKSEAPRRIAAKKDERVATDTAHDTALTNVQNTNANQSTQISNIQAVNADQNARLSAVEAVNTNQTDTNIEQNGRLALLEDFRNRVAGFAVEVHQHDSRYYLKADADTLFLRHATHPKGVQLHGSGYHATDYAPAVHSHA